jgi:rhamnose transport system ATP-binding protein
MALLNAVNVTKSYAGVHALRDASFELRSGEVHALVGENGAGKSTLIKAFTGAVIPDSGEISLDDEKIAENSPSISKSLGIAAIYQQPALFPELSVAENIAVGLESAGIFGVVNWPKRRQRAKELLDRVGARIDPEQNCRRTINAPTTIGRDRSCTRSKCSCTYTRRTDRIAFRRRYAESFSRDSRASCRRRRDDLYFAPP